MERQKTNIIDWSTIRAIILYSQGWRKPIDQKAKQSILAESDFEFDAVDPVPKYYMGGI